MKDKKISIKEVLKITKKMAECNVYYDREQAIKTLYLFERLLIGDLTFKDVLKSEKFR